MARLRQETYGQEHHINYLELLAAFLALQAFGKTWTDRVVLCRLDNVTAVTYINQKEGTASNLLCNHNLELVHCEENHTHSRTPTGSPQYNSRSGVMFSTRLLQLDAQSRNISENPGNDGAPGGASHLTKQLPQFCSWRANPKASATDAFMQDWSQQWGYANPPWCLIHRCLSKVKIQLARVVLITLFWKTQSWFPIVLELLEDYP